MPNIKPQINADIAKIIVVKWGHLTIADPLGDYSDYPQWADRNVHVYGTFGGASVGIEGNNDPLNAPWVGLTDMGGVPIAITSSPVGIKMIQENVLYVRPIVAGGDGTTDLTVVMVARKPF